MTESSRQVFVILLGRKWQILVSRMETVIREAAYGTVACLFPGMKPCVVDEMAELAVGKYQAHATGKNA